ncbi:MAG: aldo/keto reductase [Treponema sp.]|nr:aldo/keto reductase [Treponema sp.]
MMEYAKLGNSRIEVSKLCVGCMSFGKPSEDFHLWTLDEAATESMVKKALDLGITFFDTANCYAHGTSEEYLGRALKNLSVARDKVVLASKVYFNEGHLSAEAIAREIDGTLSRLGTDYLDLYIIHRFDKDTPPEETMEALHKLVVAGKVRALGASAMYGYQFAKLQSVAAHNHWTKFVSMQNHYNLLYREDERELIPICKESNVALTLYSPLAAGRLCRAEWTSESERSRTDKVARAKYDGTEETDKQIVARVAELAAQKGCTMTQISLAWHFAKGITSTLIGATKETYFEDAAGAFSVKLSAEDITYLEEPYLPHKVVGAL